MSLETFLIGLAIVAFLVLTQLGRRSFNLRRGLLPLAAIAYVAYRFWRRVPITEPNVVTLALAAGVGILMGLSLLACLKVGRNPDTGGPYTEAGAAYLILWLVLLAGRQVFVYGIQHWFTEGFGKFLSGHHVSVSVIAPAFIFLAGAIFLTRLVGILVRLKSPPLGAVAGG